MTDRVAETDRLYDLLDELANRIRGPFFLSDPALAHRCPRAGLYFFFEHGEQRHNRHPRVVRIGTHALTATSRTTLWNRLAQHRGRFGGSNPGGGNHRGSIFRRHVGSALLNQRGETELLQSWTADRPQPGREAAERDLEVEVSRVIRAMPFLWLSVPSRPDTSSDRGTLERNCIALLSAMTGGAERASTEWLGRFAPAEKVRASSLWNVNHVTDQLDPGALDILEFYVHTTEVN